MGEEPYYIDKLSEYIEQNILSEEERGFNQTVLYGRDVSVEDIVSTAKRYPMMADRQVVIVKEAQDLSRTIDKIESYVNNPMATTVLVFCYKYKTLDKRKKVTKLLAQNGVVYESKKLYENQVGDWIKRVLAGKKYTIDPTWYDTHIKYSFYEKGDYKFSVYTKDNTWINTGYVTIEYSK